jgi:hypothetical protein
MFFIMVKQLFISAWCFACMAFLIFAGQKVKLHIY